MPKYLMKIWSTGLWGPLAAKLHVANVSALFSYLAVGRGLGRVIQGPEWPFFSVSGHALPVKAMLGRGPGLPPTSCLCNLKSHSQPPDDFPVPTHLKSHSSPFPASSLVGIQLPKYVFLLWNGHLLLSCCSEKRMPRPSLFEKGERCGAFLELW